MTTLDAHNRDADGRLWAPVLDTAERIAESIEASYIGWDESSQAYGVADDVRQWGQMYGR